MTKASGTGMDRTGSLAQFVPGPPKLSVVARAKGAGVRRVFGGQPERNLGRVVEGFICSARRLRADAGRRSRGRVMGPERAQGGG